MTSDATLRPVGGRLVTPPVVVLGSLFVASVLLVLYRFVFGLGSIAALNDGYPWGPWKVVSVIVFTAYSSGGYAVALLVYVLNRERYHTIARTALLTSALGYTAAVVTLGIDIGRPWNFWRLIVVTGWNVHSVLLEIAVCISTYIIFLWLEMAPPFLEAATASNSGILKRTATRATQLLERWLPWIVAMAIVLPSMHQSSLGSLMLLAGPRLHPYWQTPLLPLLFLLSCWVLGYAFVIMTSLLSSLAWDRRVPTPALTGIARVMAWLIAVSTVVRVSDLLARPEVFAAPRGGYVVLALFELCLPLAAALFLLNARTPSPRALFLSATGVLIGGGFYRLDAALVAFMPGGQYSYFPFVSEMAVTVGFTSAAILAYIVIVKRFAILPERVAHA